MNIFCDIDSVLSNWMKSACEACNIDYNDPTIRKAIKNNKLIPECSHLTELEVWQKIAEKGVSFYANLELLPWAKKLYSELCKLGDVCFLTSPGNLVKYNKSAYLGAAGKVIWVNKHFKTNNLLIGYNKHFCANHNSILIDDSPRKIEEFKKAGGHVYLWPNDVSILDGDINANQEIEKLANFIKNIKKNRKENFIKSIKLEDIFGD